MTGLKGNDMTEWHFATAFERIADTIGDQPALICEGEVRTWTEFDNRSARIAAILSEHGLGPNSKTGIYLHNSNEYLEAHHGICKTRGCPINVNYRYQEEELVYLLNNADAEALIFQARYAGRISAIRHRLEKIRCLIQVADESNETLIEGAIDYERALATAVPMPRIERKSDDLYMLYTGGTTGMPKGVMYANGEHCAGLVGVGALTGAPVPESFEQLPDCIRQSQAANLLPIGLVCCPLMHGTGIWIGALLTHLAGGAVVTVKHLGLDPDLLWSQVEANKVTLATIVGDAFARPMLASLRAAKDRGEPYNIASLRLMISSGVMWSREIKDGLLEFNVTAFRQSLPEDIQIRLNLGLTGKMHLLSDLAGRALRSGNPPCCPWPRTRFRPPLPRPWTWIPWPPNSWRTIPSAPSAGADARSPGTALRDHWQRPANPDQLTLLPGRDCRYRIANISNKPHPTNQTTSGVSRP